ncbi:hypothetical protein EEB14_33975 [Rhodococcus sp. WS4]|nr:hypothetical protein EEB14_33975 [Rhodococcus sp. WS4]
MCEYLVPLEKAEDNLLITHEGRVWANYLLQGVNVSPYNPTTIVDAQGANKELFKALSTLRSADMLLLGVKAKVQPEDIISRIVAGIPDISIETHPALYQWIDEFYKQLKRGVYEEFERVYFLSIEIPTGTSAGSRAFARAGATNLVDDINMRMVREQEREFFLTIPSTFRAQRTNPDHLRWVHERMRTRGLSVSSMPGDNQSSTFSRGGFTDVMINKVADTDVVFDEFLERLDKGLLPEKERKVKIAQFRKNYRSIRWGQQLAVHSPQQRSDALPDGPASVQSVMAIESFPTEEKKAINSFTYLVDQWIGCDADFALRFHFSQQAISVDSMRQFRKTLDSEEAANAADEFDADDYDNRWREIQALHGSVKKETGPRGIEVAAIFALAHPNRATLRNQVRAFKTQLENSNFTVTHPVGGQFDLLMMMLPGSSCSELGGELKQSSTVHQFSACLPVRRTVAGDAVGFPIAINKENALSQIIHHDLLNATDKGNASIAATGGQGSGKSNFQKVLVGHMSDMNRPNYIIDQSTHGEYVVFSRQLAATEVVDCRNPNVSLDPLKTMPSAVAKQVFLDLMLPLIGLAPDSEEALLLSDLLSDRSRATNRIKSSVDIIEHLDGRGGTKVAQSLRRKLLFWAGQPYTRILFDPRGEDGRPRVLPPFNPSANNVVFLTRGLTVPKGELTDKTPASERFAQVLYTTVAEHTAYQFSITRGLCGFFGDEMSFLEGSTVPEKMIKTPDRTGRKDQKFIVATSQIPKDFNDGNYDLIKKKLILKQETRANAIDAFTWADIPATEKMIERMLTDTSPMDPNNNNMPIPGREGEGWYNDGHGSIVRVKTLGQITKARRRYADTTSSKMIRMDDLAAAGVDHG